MYAYLFIVFFVYRIWFISKKKKKKKKKSDQVRKYGYAGERPVYHRFLNRGLSAIEAMICEDMIGVYMHTVLRMRQYAKFVRSNANEIDCN